MKLGDTRWSADFYDRLEFDQYVLRTIRGKHGYLVQHIHGVTWVKRSTKHGDFGYLPNVPDVYRRKFYLPFGVPYSATKRGALATLIASLRRDIKKYGADFVEDYDGEEEPEPALSLKLKRAISAHKRIKT